MTEPREYMTLPYRVTETVVLDLGWLRANACAVFSISALDMPMALTGYTALSVLRHTTDRTPAAAAASITLWLPMTLVLTAWAGTVSYTHLRAPRDGLLSRMPS